jgi:hypothetical protein
MLPAAPLFTPAAFSDYFSLLSIVLAASLYTVILLSDLSFYRALIAFSRFSSSPSSCLVWPCLTFPFIDLPCSALNILFPLSHTPCLCVWTLPVNLFLMTMFRYILQLSLTLVDNCLVHLNCCLLSHGSPPFLCLVDFVRRDQAPDPVSFLQHRASRPHLIPSPTLQAQVFRCAWGRRHQDHGWWR